MRACETHGGRPVGVSESLSIHTRHSSCTHLLSLSSGLRHLLSLAVASWRMLERFQPYVLDHFGDHVTVSVCVEHYTVLYCDAVALSLQTPL